MLPSGYFSLNTQRIANCFPSWMTIRADASSVGQQFINPVAMALDTMERNYTCANKLINLYTADINTTYEMGRVDIPRRLTLDEDGTYIVIGDSYNVEISDELDDMLYRSLPTRISYIGFQDNIPEDVSFSSGVESLAYDLPYTDEIKKEHTLYFQVVEDSTGKYLERYFTLGTGYNAVIEKEVLQRTKLSDISGTITGLALANDYLVIVSDNTSFNQILVYDVRIPLLESDDPSWSGNASQSYVDPLLSEISHTGYTDIGIDPDKRYFWVGASGVGYAQYKMCFDYGIFDFDKKKLFTNEVYDSVVINDATYSCSYNPIWNYFDEYGLVLDTPRLDEETNKEYKSRLQETFKFRANSTYQGVVNGLSRELSLNKYGVFNQGEYPTNLFDDGVFPSGYEIYPSGKFPTTVSDIAKVNALYDDGYYDTLVDPSTLIPSSRFCEYTKEILETAPIIWGSGESDPYAFIWDLSPFDGGANNGDMVPDFFTNMTADISSIYFQSGVSDPDGDDLNVKITSATGDVWAPSVYTGNFFLHKDKYHLYSNEITEVIPSGDTSYQILSEEFGGPYLLNDPSGIVSSSELNWECVAELSGTPNFIFTVDERGLVSLGHEHSGLLLRYEGSPAEDWHSLPWDFNPLHGIGFDGFIWISKEKQEINADSFTLMASPTELSIGESQSLLVGTLLDINQEPIVGAEVFFSATGYPGTISPSGTAVLTQFDGTALATYYSPATIDYLSTSGIVTTVEPNLVWEDNFKGLTSDVATTLRGQASRCTIYKTIINGVEKLWAVPVKSFDQDHANIYSTEDGAVWRFEQSVSCRPGTISNGQSVWDAHPLYNMTVGVPVSTFIFRNTTYARTGSGLWKTVDGVNWSIVWDAINATTGPKESWNASSFTSNIITKAGSSEETLFDLGGLDVSGVWTTQNGTDWTRITNTVPWAPRCLGAIVNYKERIWVICGEGHAVPFTGYNGYTTNTQNTIWYSDNGIDWTEWGVAPFTSRVRFGYTVYNDKLWIIAGQNQAGSSNIVYNREVWSFDGNSWTQYDDAPWEETSDVVVTPYGGALTAIGGGRSYSGDSSLTGWQFTMKTSAAIYCPDALLDSDLSKMLLYYERPDASGYPTAVKILLMNLLNSYNLTIKPTDWVYSSDSSGYEYIIGGEDYYSTLGDNDSGDDAHNIDLRSLQLDGTPIYVAGTSGTYFTYEIDDYSNPRDYGKVIIQSPDSPSISRVLSFDTYAPLRPAGSIVESSGTYLYMNTDTNIDCSGTVYVISPIEIEVTASGWFEGTAFGPKYATIKIGLGDLQQGVLRLDEKFIDYFSYLRWTGA